MSGTFLGVLADTSIRASVAACLVAGALAALRVRASAVRHASWTAVLFAMLLMPVLTYCVPAIAIPLIVSVPPLSDDGGLETLGAVQTVRSIEAAPGSDWTASADHTAVRSGESATAEALGRPDL